MDSDIILLIGFLVYMCMAIVIIYAILKKMKLTPELLWPFRGIQFSIVIGLSFISLIYTMLVVSGTVPKPHKDVAPKYEPVQEQLYRRTVISKPDVQKQYVYNQMRNHEQQRIVNVYLQ